MSIFREDLVALIPHLRVFARHLASGNAALADDLVQDTMVNALQSQDQFTPGTNLKAWLFTILRNRFHSLVTRKHVTSEVSADDTLENHWWVPAYQETAIDVDAFRRAFQQLRPEHKEALVLATIHELPYERIAEICGCEVGTVKSRVSRARSLLKKMVMDGELPVDHAKLSAGVAGRARPVDDRCPACPMVQEGEQRRSSSFRALSLI